MSPPRTTSSNCALLLRTGTIDPPCCPTRWLNRAIFEFAPFVMRSAYSLLRRRCKIRCMIFLVDCVVQNARSSCGIFHGGCVVQMLAKAVAMVECRTFFVGCVVQLFARAVAMVICRIFLVGCAVQIFARAGAMVMCRNLADNCVVQICAGAVAMAGAGASSIGTLQVANTYDCDACPQAKAVARRLSVGAPTPIEATKTARRRSRRPPLCRVRGGS